VIALLLPVLAACGPAWEATVETPDGGSFAVDRGVLADLAAPDEEEKAVAVDRVLWAAGHRVVETLVVVDGEGARYEFDWPDTAEGAVWLPGGEITTGGQVLAPARLKVRAPALLDQVSAGITDIAPTAAAALGLAPPEQATGHAWQTAPAAHVLLLFLDGLGYVRYADAAAAGLIPVLSSLGAPQVGLTVYPPCTSVASAALLTGAAPAASGVDRRGIRKTEAETLFDVAAAAGLEVVAVEGDALAFNLRNAEMTLSGDRDGNGSTDDNVLGNALAVLEGGMPDLFYVHFHGIDDAGHDYGPRTPEEEAAIAYVDAAVGQLLDALPADTLVIIFADHGMHRVEEEGRLGNHGNLIAEDMFIPILTVHK
jgi:hypothetical protein